MPPPLDPALRATIVDELHAIDRGDADERSATALAREHHVSHQTVLRLADANGLTHLWDRVRTKRATAARQLDMAAERAVIKARLLDAAHDALDQLDEPCLVWSFGGKDNTYAEHTLPRPTAEIRRNLLTTAAIALDKHVALDRHDSDDRTESAQGAIEAFMAAVRGGHETGPDLDDVGGDLVAKVVQPDDDPGPGANGDDR